MTNQEFLQKLASEGISYAFTEYGLSEKDLTVQEGAFFEMIKEVAAAYRRAQRLSSTLEIMIEGLSE